MCRHHARDGCYLRGVDETVRTGSEMKQITRRVELLESKASVRQQRMIVAGDEAEVDALIAGLERDEDEQIVVILTGICRGGHRDRSA